MSYFSKGNGLVREVIRNPKLGTKKVSMIGKHYAFNDGFDGYSGFEVEGLPATPTEKEFLEGNPSRTSYYVPRDVASIVIPLDVLYPNCTLYIVGNTEQVVRGLPDANAVAFVPNTMKSSYLADAVYSTYQNLTFDSWILQNETTIPFVGDTTLTAEYVELFANLSAGEASIVDKVIVPPEFTEFETGVFDYVFVKFPNCEEIEFNGGPRLPAEYQEVEYIESTGTQYIDTGVVSGTNPSFDMVLSPTLLTKRMYGSTSSNYQSADAIILEIQSGGFQLIYKGFHNGNYGVSIDEKYRLSLLGGTYTVKNSNGENLYSVGIGFLSSSPTRTNYVFSANDTTEPNNKASAKLFSLKIYDDNSVLARDFVPCYRLSDNVIGLYDLVGNQFYVNQGTGVFLKGNVIRSVRR